MFCLIIRLLVFLWAYQRWQRLSVCVCEVRAFRVVLCSQHRLITYRFHTITDYS